MPRKPKPPLRPEDVEHLNALVAQMAEAKAEVELARKELKRVRGDDKRTTTVRKRLRKAERRLAQLAELEIPQHMDLDMLVKRHETPDGHVVHLELSPKIKPPLGKWQELMQWLEDNGHADMASQLREPAASKDTKRSRDMKLLGTFFRRQYEAGNSLPLDLFGWSRTYVAKLTPPRRSA
jgi:hypothetical protein